MKIICFLSLLFVCLSNFAQKPKIIFLQTLYAIDTNSVWKSNILPQEQFKVVRNNNINIGYNKNAAVWCYFKLKNTDLKHSATSWICFDNNHLDSIFLFNKNEVKLLGDRTKNSSSFIETQAFKITLNPNEERLVLFKVKKSISFMEFSFHIGKEKNLHKNSQIKIATVSFLIGIVFLLLFFNSVLFFITKKKLYLFYIIYSILSALYVLVSSNYLKHFIFTEFEYFSELRIYFASLWFMTMSLFLSNFLNLKIHQPTKYKIIKNINYINAFIIIFSVISLILNELYFLKVFFYLGYFNFLLIIMSIVFATIYSLKIDKKKGIYVIISFLPQLIWSLSIILRSFEIINQTFNQDWLVIIGFYEIFLFGFILTKNYIDAFQENKILLLEITEEKEKTLQTITQTQIRERRSIANLIHDNFGSKIAYILQLLQLNKIDLAKDNVKQFASEIREISHKILPKSLDDGALVASLKKQISILNSGLENSEIELFSYDFPDNVVALWIYDMYLISLELINNSLKHGKSKAIIIELYAYPTNYLFQFIDDGIGFKIKNYKKGYGLDNIEKRVLYYKGTFEINSVENQGTNIQISIPRNKSN